MLLFKDRWSLKQEITGWWQNHGISFTDWSVDVKVVTAHSHVGKHSKSDRDCVHRVDGCRVRPCRWSVATGVPTRSSIMLQPFTSLPGTSSLLNGEGWWMEWTTVSRELCALWTRLPSRSNSSRAILCSCQT
jgi:hypothetical protein